MSLLQYLGWRFPLLGRYTERDLRNDLNEKVLERLDYLVDNYVDAYTKVESDARYYTQTGGQIAFPAIQNPSADANTLDDYEEGLFTPVMEGLTGAGTPSYATQNGVYTKVGRLVTVNVHIVATLTGVTGQLCIKGFPFGNGTGVVGRAPIVFPFWSGLTLPADAIGIVGFLVDTARVRIYYHTIAAGTFAVTDAHVTSSVTLYGGMTYHAS